MRVLHLFDKYLNTTMNWAANLLVHTHGVEHHVAAPWIVQNEYYYPQFHYHYGALQNLVAPNADSEWTGGITERVVRGLETKSGWWLRRLEALDVDVIHAHFGPVGVLALPLVRRTGKPLVITFYGYDYEKALIVRPSLRAAYAKMFSVAATCIALGPETARMLEAAGCPSAKIRQIPLSVSMQSIDFQVNIKRERPLRILQVSSFTEKKGQIDTVYAFAEALKTRPGMQLTLIGEVVERHIHDAVLQAIAKLGILQSVTVLGFLNNESVRTQMQQHDVFIHPSHRSSQGDTEGLPVAILEALASGLPVISTHHADIPSAVLHEQNGLLCAPRDVEGIAMAILRFSAMPDTEFAQYRGAARARVEEEFDIRLATKRLAAVYSEVLKRSAPSES